jgi:hypothetical protein
MAKKTTSDKVNKTQLMHLLAVSYPTALKEYQVIIDSLALKRKYLTVNDLIKYGIL